MQRTGQRDINLKSKRARPIFFGLMILAFLVFLLIVSNVFPFQASSVNQSTQRICSSLDSLTGGILIPHGQNSQVPTNRDLQNLITGLDRIDSSAPRGVRSDLLAYSNTLEFGLNIRHKIAKHLISANQAFAENSVLNSRMTTSIIHLSNWIAQNC